MATEVAAVGTITVRVGEDMIMAEEAITAATTMEATMGGAVMTILAAGSTTIEVDTTMAPLHPLPVSSPCRFPAMVSHRRHSCPLGMVGVLLHHRLAGFHHLLRRWIPTPHDNIAGKNDRVGFSHRMGRHRLRTCLRTTH
jgi:hypothetical protein